MSNYSDSSFSTDPNSSWYKIFSRIHKGSKVLDVGCSSGNFGKVLIEEKGCTVDGLELDPADYEIAKKHLRNVYHLNVETDDLADITDSYDYIYFGDVIEHLVWPAASLRRIHRLLKPGGQLVFSIPNMAHLSVRLKLLQGDFQYGETGLLDKTHLHFYTTKELERILGEAGYDLIHFDPVLKDLPQEVVTEELGKVGLELTDEFLTTMRTSEASIYQMVGAAKLKTEGQKPVKATLPSSSPVDIFQIYLDNTVKSYKNRIEEQERHMQKLETYAKDTVKLYEKAAHDLAVKERQLSHLRSHPVHRFIKKVNKLTGRQSGAA